MSEGKLLQESLEELFMQLCRYDTHKSGYLSTADFREVLRRNGADLAQIDQFISQFGYQRVFPSSAIGFPSPPSVVPPGSSRRPTCHAKNGKSPPPESDREGSGITPIRTRETAEFTGAQREGYTAVHLVDYVQWMEHFGAVAFPTATPLGALSHRPIEILRPHQRKDDTRVPLKEMTRPKMNRVMPGVEHAPPPAFSCALSSAPPRTSRQPSSHTFQWALQYAAAHPQTHDAPDILARPPHHDDAHEEGSHAKQYEDRKEKKSKEKRRMETHKARNRSERTRQVVQNGRPHSFSLSSSSPQTPSTTSSPPRVTSHVQEDQSWSSPPEVPSSSSSCLGGATTRAEDSTGEQEWPFTTVARECPPPTLLSPSPRADVEMSGRPPTTAMLRTMLHTAAAHSLPTAARQEKAVCGRSSAAPSQHPEEHDAKRKEKEKEEEKEKEDNPTHVAVLSHSSCLFDDCFSPPCPPSSSTPCRTGTDHSSLPQPPSRSVSSCSSCSSFSSPANLEQVAAPGVLSDPQRTAEAEGVCLYTMYHIWRARGLPLSWSALQAVAASQTGQGEGQWEDDMAGDPHPHPHLHHRCPAMAPHPPLAIPGHDTGKRGDRRSIPEEGSAVFRPPSTPCKMLSVQAFQDVVSRLPPSMVTQLCAPPFWFGMEIGKEEEAQHKTTKKSDDGVWERHAAHRSGEMVPSTHTEEEKTIPTEDRCEWQHSNERATRAHSPFISPVSSTSASSSSFTPPVCDTPTRLQERKKTLPRVEAWTRSHACVTMATPTGKKEPSKMALSSTSSASYGLKGTTTAMRSASSASTPSAVEAAHPSYALQWEQHQHQKKKKRKGLPGGGPPPPSPATGVPTATSLGRPSASHSNDLSEALLPVSSTLSRASTTTRSERACRSMTTSSIMGGGSGGPSRLPTMAGKRFTRHVPVAKTIEVERGGGGGPSPPSPMVDTTLPSSPFSAAEDCLDDIHDVPPPPPLLLLSSDTQKEKDVPHGRGAGEKRWPLSPPSRPSLDGVKGSDAASTRRWNHAAPSDRKEKEEEGKGGSIESALSLTSSAGLTHSLPATETGSTPMASFPRCSSSSSSSVAASLGVEGCLGMEVSPILSSHHHPSVKEWQPCAVPQRCCRTSGHPHTVSVSLSPSPLSSPHGPRAVRDAHQGGEGEALEAMGAEHERPPSTRMEGREKAFGPFVHSCGLRAASPLPSPPPPLSLPPRPALPSPSPPAPLLLWVSPSRVE